ncbi:MAG: hypothetical protein A3A43_02160 [Candidatus Liptonbacteria bacterium RIFCSPLOWO2_01_FULL_56_20]|uniref:Uncharacterized protein n=1 Tax=Candidatus Liptonbacteria bacterium RIFCSPLOWO2_01_FULL_56_20 TaxID=1798652 RepID=A0A1G2CKB0_9BACT|nr:MAG: hypothetical protein A2681_02410 [Candidatus Liptonbacteria bacterium RIFCSPHIGHO2_01_FULL_56_18b]OGZ01815.1 MAG: hypothetical protein A3A43_02160 [Candidatus Liptonbacteria bacterium RIFCSPLOWO2_01_FULL_56_20]
MEEDPLGLTDRELVDALIRCAELAGRSGGAANQRVYRRDVVRIRAIVLQRLEQHKQRIAPA